MASDSRSEAAGPDQVRRQAEHLGRALDALEAALDALEPGAAPAVVAEALREPVAAFAAAAKEGAR